MELSKQAQDLVDSALEFLNPDNEPIQKTGPSENNPVRGLGFHLALAYLQAHWLVQTIRLMEIPTNMWHVHQVAMAHAVGVETAAAYHLEQHVQVVRLLKQVGY